MDKNELDIQILAEKLNSLIPLIDAFVEKLEEKDYELLEETREILKDKIQKNNSALPIIMACGGNYDDVEDRFKLETLSILITLFKTRKEYRDEMIKAKQHEMDMENILNLFGL